MRVARYAHGTARAWHGIAWHGISMAQPGTPKCWHGTAMARHGMDTARDIPARHLHIGQGTLWHDMACGHPDIYIHEYSLVPFLRSGPTATYVGI